MQEKEKIVYYRRRSDDDRIGFLRVYGIAEVLDAGVIGVFCYYIKLIVLLILEYLNIILWGNLKMYVGAPVVGYDIFGRRILIQLPLI